MRLFLDLHKDRRIHALQKHEAELKAKIVRPGITLLDLQQDLQICVGHYHKIKAIGMLQRQLSFLFERSLLLERGFKDPSQLKECHIILQNVAWSLHRLNSDQAPEYIQFFKPILGDISQVEKFIDREVDPS